MWRYKHCKFTHKQKQGLKPLHIKFPLYPAFILQQLLKLISSVTEGPVSPSRITHVMMKNAKRSYAKQRQIKQSNVWGSLLLIELDQQDWEKEN